MGVPEFFGACATLSTAWGNFGGGSPLADRANKERSFRTGSFSLNAGTSEDKPRR